MVKKPVMALKVLFAACVLFSAIPGFSQESATEASGEVSVQKEPSREEKLDRLNRILKTRKTVREAMAGMVLVGTPEKGHIEYEGVKLEDFDDETLNSILEDVINEARAQQMKNMERIQKQLQQVENLNRTNAHLNATRNIAPSPSRALPVSGNVAPSVPASRPSPVPQSPPRTPQTR